MIQLFSYLVDDSYRMVNFESESNQIVLSCSDQNESVSNQLFTQLLPGYYSLLYDYISNIFCMQYLIVENKTLNNNNAFHIKLK